jgi:CubicO group peptidase (beta-lactamase class C family)
MLMNTTEVPAAQDEYSLFDRVDAYIEEKMAEVRMPGAYAVVRNDEILYIKGYGISDDSGRLIIPDTPFLLTSVSKSFTALAIAQLVEAGKLELDSPVNHYISEFRVADEAAYSSFCCFK